MSMVINGTSGITFPDGSLQGIGVGRRNLIINGAMQVAQRGTQVTGVTTAGYKTVDRFKVATSNLGTWTVEQSTDSPSNFSNSFKLTCTTADASPAAADLHLIQYFIEAQDLQHLGYGSSDAQELTLSFWIKSNKTGSATVELRQKDNSNKHVTLSYSVSSADTWEYKTISIPADTSGLINNDNGSGIEIEWWINSGSDFTGGTHQTTWASPSNTNRNVSNLGVGGATSDYFAITGVQLEVGSVATPFEHRSYGEELALCQRYYQLNPSLQGAMDESNVSLVCPGFGKDMRASPTFAVANNSNPIHRPGVAFYTISSISAAVDYINVTPSTTFGASVIAQVIFNKLSADAEL